MCVAERESIGPAFLHECLRVFTLWRSKCKKGRHHATGKQPSHGGVTSFWTSGTPRGSLCASNTSALFPSLLWTLRNNRFLGEDFSKQYSKRCSSTLIALSGFLLVSQALFSGFLSPSASDQPCSRTTLVFFSCLYVAFYKYQPPNFHHFSLQSLAASLVHTKTCSELISLVKLS